jgi:hypothetical protein
LNFSKDDFASFAGQSDTARAQREGYYTPGHANYGRITPTAMQIASTPPSVRYSPLGDSYNAETGQRTDAEGRPMTVIGPPKVRIPEIEWHPQRILDALTQPLGSPPAASR